MRGRRGLAILALALLAACEGKKPAAGERAGGEVFPALPRSPEAAAALIGAETRRPPPASEPEIDAAAIVKAAEARGLGSVPAGQGAVVRALQAVLDGAAGDAVLLFGTWHDAPGQLDAFRRLVGPGGLHGLHVVAAEQFRADGAWQGVPRDVQRGDGLLLDQWTARGDRAAFAALAAHHRDGDYAAWKLGYEDAVLDLLVTARATGVRFTGCDMPAALQDLSGLPPGEARNRLREIHCLRSLPGGHPRRAALVWGDAHVRRSGLVRFLPPAAAVLAVHLVGQRQGPGALEAALGKQLVVNDPVLVPLAPEEAALLLPDETIGGHIDRVLTTEEGPPETGVTARAEIPGVLWIGDRRYDLGREPVRMALPAGDHAYAFAGGGLRIVGALHLIEGHRVEIGFDPEARLTTYVERAPR